MRFDIVTIFPEFFRGPFDFGVVPKAREAGTIDNALLLEVRSDLADSVDRMAGDVDLNMDLALEGYQGPLWDYFSNELAKYGYAVIASWIGRRMIFERCKSRGFGGLPAMDRPFTDDENAELTNETVAKALAHFRTDVLMKRK